MMVSVVIPFFKNFAWLKEAVKSVLEQTYIDYEIIVVNDGSIEDDFDFLEEYGSFIKYIKIANSGSAFARNKGIESCTGKYIAFLDSDDLWLPGKLSAQVEYMERENCMWSHCSYSTFEDKTCKVLNKVDVSLFKGDVFNNCLVSSPIGTPCVIIRREVFVEDKDLRFNVNMRSGQDSYLWLLLSEKFTLGVIDDFLVKVRIRKGGNTASKASIHLKVKSQLYRYISYKRGCCVNRYLELSSLTIFAYKICDVSNKILEVLTKKVSTNYAFVEFVAKFLYLPAYFVLKYIKRTKLKEFYGNS